MSELCQNALYLLRRWESIENNFKESELSLDSRTYSFQHNGVSVKVYFQKELSFDALKNVKKMLLEFYDERIK